MKVYNLRICIIDYGLGNIASIFNAMKNIGADPIVSDEEAIIKNSSHLILPGVGSFKKGMQELQDRRLDEILNHEVINNKKPIILDFWAEWCGPCKQIGPILEEISDEYNDKIIVGKMDVDENPETPGKYQIRGIPTMLLFNNGELIDTKVGMSSKADLKEWIDRNI